MPTLFRILGYCIFFWSNEPEPIHVHVAKSPHANSTKIIVQETVSVAFHNKEIPTKDLKKILLWVSQNRAIILDEWIKTFR